jgi:hypothetical protein
MPSKQDISEGVWGTVLQDPRAKVKAGLPESQFPRVLFTLLDDHTSMARPLRHVEVNQSA